MSGKRDKIIRAWARKLCDTSLTGQMHTTLYIIRQLCDPVPVDLTLLKRMGAKNTIRHAEGSYKDLCRKFKKQAAA